MTRFTASKLLQNIIHKQSPRFKDDPKIFLHLGHSPEILQQIACSLLNKSVLYWLDAHWCAADQAAGESSQCPLLDELGAISGLNEQSIILIDDARLFLCPPPRPHEISQWPSFDSVLKRLRGLSSAHEIMILNDVIICFPAVVRESLKFYAHEHSTDWLTVMDKARDYDLLLAQLKEKEDAVQEKESAIQEKEAAIQEKEAAIQEKEAVIRQLAEACEARLNGMNRLARRIGAPEEQPDSLRRRLYVLGFAE